MKDKKTISTIFMVPTLGTPKGSLLENGFLNAYLDDDMNELKYNKLVIYLLFKPNDVDIFKSFLDNEYERTNKIIEDYDYTGGFIVVVYKLDDKYKKDFDLIIEGKYSKTSKEFQNLFPKVIKIKKNGLHRDELSLQYRVFNKTNDLVEYWQDKLGLSEWSDDYEVWTTFEIHNEILTKKVLEEYES
jgi:hypothetical protein